VAVVERGGGWGGGGGSSSPQQGSKCGEGRGGQRGPKNRHISALLTALKATRTHHRTANPNQARGLPAARVLG
jgi:hypothetical protein